jgi:hypothetical protein
MCRSVRASLCVCTVKGPEPESVGTMPAVWANATSELSAGVATATSTMVGAQPWARTHALSRTPAVHEATFPAAHSR